MPEDATLESQLARVRDNIAENYPQVWELVRRLIVELESSAMGRALKLGDEAPDFELKDAENDTPVRLWSALEAGPVVLSFYRGHW